MPDGQKKDPKQHNGQTFPIYSLLVGIYPVLALAAFNISQIDLSTTYRSLLLSAALALLLFGLLRLLLRDWSRAAFLSLLLLVLFYSYGHVYNLIKTTTVFGFAIGRHRLLAPFCRPPSDSQIPFGFEVGTFSPPDGPFFNGAK